MTIVDTPSRSEIKGNKRFLKTLNSMSVHEEGWHGNKHFLIETFNNKPWFHFLTKNKNVTQKHTVKKIL